MTKQELIKNIERAINYFDHQAEHYRAQSNNYKMYAEKLTGKDREDYKLFKALADKNFGRQDATSFAGFLLRAILEDENTLLDDYFRKYEEE